MNDDNISLFPVCSQSLSCFHKVFDIKSALVQPFIQMNVEKYISTPRASTSDYIKKLVIARNKDDVK